MSAAPPLAPRRARSREWLVCLAVCVTLLGQGERCRIDPRFYSPQATLAVCWEAIRSNDAETLTECIDAPQADMPYPGMQWFLPPTSRLTLHSIRTLPIADDRVLASYEIHVLPKGGSEEVFFTTTSELVRDRGEWRVVKLPCESPSTELRGLRLPIPI